MITLEEHLENVIIAHECISKPYTIHYFGHKYVVFPHVFSPILTASTTTAVRSMRKRTVDFADRKVLDMGCGCGVLAIEAVGLGAEYSLAVDVSANAVANTAENIGSLGLKHRLDVVKGDLFAEVPRDVTFDVVLANLPLADRKCETEMDRAFFDEGYKTIERFAKEVSDYMTDGGLVFLNCASIADTPRIVRWAVEGGLHLEQVDLFDDYIFDHYVFIFHKSQR